jgi:hypothetical protein
MLTLCLLPDSYSIWRLPADADTPVVTGDFSCVIRTAHELSGVCAETHVPAGATVDTGWRCLEFVGPFDLTLTGIMVQVAQPLAQAGVPIFTLATYNTDYLLVPHTRLTDVQLALHNAGIRVVEPTS